MFSLLKLLVKIAIILIVAHFVMRYFGYDINRNYFNESKAKCEERLKECTQELIKKGAEGAECDFKCVDPKLIIKKN